VSSILSFAGFIISVETELIFLMLAEILMVLIFFLKAKSYVINIGKKAVFGPPHISANVFLKMISMVSSLG
jgi:hypothetical protein